MEIKTLTPHSNDVKSVFFSPKLGKLVSCSMDGQLILTDLEQDKSETILKMEGFIGAVQIETGIIVASISGIIMHLGFDGGVEQLKLKCKARPSAIFATDRILLLGDWEGNVYQYDIKTGASRDY